MNQLCKSIIRISDRDSGSNYFSYKIQDFRILSYKNLIQ